MKDHLRARAHRRLWAVMGIGICAGLIAAASGAAANVTKPGPLAPGTRYLALGDSVTFGYMESSVVPAPNYKDPASFHGYPEQLGQALHVGVANAACPGETSASLINANAPSNGCENFDGHKAAGFRTHFPLHVHYKGSQLAFALSYLKAHRNVRLVSLMIGANDYFLCVETTKDGCASELPALIKSIGKNVKTILSSIRKKAKYGGQLAIVNYYSLNYASAATNAQSQLLNKTVDGAAKPFHVVFADGYGEYRNASVHSGNNPCIAGLLTQLGNPGKCGVHPSYAGQALLAKAVARAIKN